MVETDWSIWDTPVEKPEGVRVGVCYSKECCRAASGDKKKTRKNVPIKGIVITFDLRIDDCPSCGDAIVWELRDKQTQTKKLSKIGCE